MNGGVANNISSGYTAELYTQYRISSFGFEVLQVSQDNKYDLVVMASKPLKVQVKSNSQAKESSGSNSYKFQLSCGSGTKRMYREGDYDIMALFCFEKEAVLFQPHISQLTKRIQGDNFSRENELASWQEVTKGLL